MARRVVSRRDLMNAHHPVFYAFVDTTGRRFQDFHGAVVVDVPTGNPEDMLQAARRAAAHWANGLSLEVPEVLAAGPYPTASRAWDAVDNLSVGTAAYVPPADSRELEGQTVRIRAV